jgi:undecaprenyl-diphosphatase
MPEHLYRYRHDRAVLKPLLSGLAILLLMLMFTKLSSEVFEGDTRGFDMYLLRRAQSLRVGYPQVVNVMRDLSGLGSTVLLSILTMVTVGYLALVGARPMSALVAGAVVTGAVMVDLMKAAFGRLRPDAAFAEMAAQGLSFPSGHSSISAIVYLTLGALVASTRARFIEQTYIMAVSAVMTGLVGISRVALGVHWATDVMAGWAFGAAWSMVWLLLAARFARAAAP